ncbi:hypothetical protein DL765_000681 [Monosporascus sp. GIB2]|nr:hypothetical protein DL765_000681 [Monosporascus sp. GIB2]
MTATTIIIMTIMTIIIIIITVTATVTMIPSPAPPPSSVPPQPSPPRINQSDFQDLPPAYSQLSSRPGSVVLRNGEVPYKEETGKRQAYSDDELTSQDGSSHRSMRNIDVREMGCRRKQPLFYLTDDKGRRWERDMTKEADAPYMIPEAGTGAHPKRCPYRGRVYELD